MIRGPLPFNESKAEPRQNCLMVKELGPVKAGAPAPPALNRGPGYPTTSGRVVAAESRRG